MLPGFRRFMVPMAHFEGTKKDKKSARIGTSNKILMGCVTSESSELRNAGNGESFGLRQMATEPRHYPSYSDL